MRVRERAPPFKFCPSQPSFATAFEGRQVSSAAVDLWRRNPSALAALAVVAVVLVRLVAVVATPLEIGPDEAQYWRWGQTLDFGYYSKPPLIAWVIGATTSLFGDSEWAIRLASPVLHGIAALFLFQLGRWMFDPKIGAWAAALYLLMPGVWLSSTIMSTDAVLLPMWSGALFFLWRLREQPKLINGALAGVFIGLAMLAKYAALYLFAGAVLAALIDPVMRRSMLSPAGAAVFVMALVVWGPNLWWNAAHDFATVSHTADNANLGQAGFNPLHVFTFLGDQMAVFGPITLIVFLIALTVIPRPKDRDLSRRELWLACFIVPVLVVILIQEIMSRAHANWAAAAYPAASALTASWISRSLGKFRMAPVIASGVALNVLVGAFFVVAWVAPSIGDALGASNAYKRVRGWEQTAADLNQIALEHNATSLMMDEREVWHGVDYYGRDMNLPPLRAWRRGDHPRSHAEEAGILQPGEDARALVVSISKDARPKIRADFDAIEQIGYLRVPLGSEQVRELKLYLASGYKPLPRTPEYEAKYKPLSED